MNNVTCEICSKVQPIDDCWTVKQSGKITYHCRINSIRCETFIKPNYNRKDDSFRLINVSSPTLQGGGYYSYADYEIWAKESDKIIRIKEEEKHKIASAEKDKHTAWISTLRVKYGDFWKGPFDVLVPWSIQKIHSEDGINYLSYMRDVFKDDSYFVLSTELRTDGPPYSEKEYKKKFTEKSGSDYIYVGLREDN
jgi:hypothetical protein